MFAFQLGRADAAAALAPFFRHALAAGGCRWFTQAYLNGVLERTRELPVAWAAALDRLADTRAEDAFRLTVTADPSRRGLARLFRAAEGLSGEQLTLFQQTGYGGWPVRLGEDDRRSILARLAAAAEAGSPAATSAGLHLFARWYADDTAVPASLVEPTLALAAGFDHRPTPLGSFWWWQALDRLAPHAPERVADLYVDALTNPTSRLTHADREGDSLLHTLATAHPEAVMEAVGRSLLHPERRVVFLVEVFRGLFEAIGLEVVRRFVGEHGPECLHLIARHLNSPSTTEAGVALPPLTNWLLREHEGDERAFHAFLAGRHSGARVWVGDRTAERRAEMAPFLAHPLRRVREWAEYEIRHEERFAGWHRRWDEEDERV